MAKKQNNSVQAKRNRNNRKRGAKFEKTIADHLGMFVVPYSGSNARFGYGDIRDVEGTTGGCWLGEAKTMTPKSPKQPRYELKHEWFTDLKSKAVEYGIKPFFTFTRNAVPFKFIMLPIETFRELDLKTMKTYHKLEVKDTKNIFLPESEMAEAWGVKSFYSEPLDNNYLILGTSYLGGFVLMTLKQFEQLIEETQWHWRYKDGNKTP